MLDISTYAIYQWTTMIELCFTLRQIMDYINSWTIKIFTCVSAHRLDTHYRLYYNQRYILHSIHVTEKHVQLLLLLFLIMFRNKAHELEFVLSFSFYKCPSIGMEFNHRATNFTSY